MANFQKMATNGDGKEFCKKRVLLADVNFANDLAEICVKDIQTYADLHKTNNIAHIP